MRFLTSEVLNGACFAALIVLAAGQASKIAVGSASNVAVPAQEIVDRAQQADVQAPVDRTSSQERVVLRDSATAIETANATPRDGSQKSEVVSLPGPGVTPQPAADTARKPSGGLGAAADGGIDAYVPPIVRQRPATPSLKREAKPKGKGKVKAAASAKRKSDAKQASRAVAPASVKR